MPAQDNGKTHAMKHSFCNNETVGNNLAFGLRVVREVSAGRQETAFLKDNECGAQREGNQQENSRAGGGGADGGEDAAAFLGGIYPVDRGSNPITKHISIAINTCGLWNNVLGH